jgi:hypothetical protein
MKPSVIVWDLETVPDLGGFAAANNLVGKSDVEVREAIGEKFPKHIYYSIVCIGALIAHWETDYWAVETPWALPFRVALSHRLFGAPARRRLAEVSGALRSDSQGSF